MPCAVCRAVSSPCFPTRSSSAPLLSGVLEGLAATRPSPAADCVPTAPELSGRSPHAQPSALLAPDPRHTGRSGPLVVPSSRGFQGAPSRPPDSVTRGPLLTHALVSGFKCHPYASGSFV